MLVFYGNALAFVFVYGFAHDGLHVAWLSDTYYLDEGK